MICEMAGIVLFYLVGEIYKVEEVLRKKVRIR
jgi:hypothetical protein